MVSPENPPTLAVLSSVWLAVGTLRATLVLQAAEAQSRSNNSRCNTEVCVFYYIIETVAAPVVGLSVFKSVSLHAHVSLGLSHLANATIRPAAPSFVCDMDFHGQQAAVFWRPINRIPAWFYGSFLFLFSFSKMGIRRGTGYELESIPRHRDLINAKHTVSD